MIISAARLVRIHDAAERAAALCPGPWACNHGYLVVDRAAPNSRMLASPVGLEGATAMRLAQHADPATALELLRGYKLAKEKGLL